MSNQTKKTDLSYLAESRPIVKLRSADLALLNAETLKSNEAKPTKRKRTAKTLTDTEALEIKNSQHLKQPAYKNNFLTEAEAYKETKAQKQVTDNEIVRLRHEKSKLEVESKHYQGLHAALRWSLT